MNTIYNLSPELTKRSIFKITTYLKQKIVCFLTKDAQSVVVINNAKFILISADVHTTNTAQRFGQLNWKCVVQNDFHHLYKAQSPDGKYWVITGS